jgi:hypothetical protein
MLNSYENTRALVAERQHALRNEVRLARLGRRLRSGRRHRHLTLPWLSDVGNPPPASSAVRESLFG